MHTHADCIARYAYSNVSLRLSVSVVQLLYWCIVENAEIIFKQVQSLSSLSYIAGLLFLKYASIAGFWSKIANFTYPMCI